MMNTAEYRQLRATLHAAARAAAQRGWKVFPLLPGTKRPLIRGWEERATNDQDEIDAWWRSRPFNIGIACGPSGLIVVDLDTPKLASQPPRKWSRRGRICGAIVLAEIAERCAVDIPTDTFTVHTGRGGEHLYFQRPADRPLKNRGSLDYLIDVRGVGGLVVGPCSVVDGRPYTVSNPAAPADIQQRFADLLSSSATTANQGARGRFTAAMTTSTRRERYLAAAVRNELQRIATAPPQTRNHNLYIASSLLGQLVAGGLLNEVDIRERLIDAGIAIGQTDLEARSTVESGLRAGARNPRRIAS